MKVEQTKTKPSDEKINFDDQIKKLTIGHVEFTLNSFDDGHFANIVENTSKRHIAYEEARKTLSKKDFFAKLEAGEIQRGESYLGTFREGWKIYFDGRVQNDLHDFFKGKEQLILQAIRKGKGLDLLDDVSNCKNEKA